jgi:hypothetical protein
VPLPARPGGRGGFLPCNVGACRPRADFESGERIRLRSSLVVVSTTRLTRHFNAAFQRIVAAVVQHLCACSQQFSDLLMARRASR